MCSASVRPEHCWTAVTRFGEACSYMMQVPSYLLMSSREVFRPRDTPMSRNRFAGVSLVTPTPSSVQNCVCYGKTRMHADFVLKLSETCSASPGCNWQQILQFAHDARV